MVRFLGYGRQSIDPSDVDAVVGALTGDFLTQGPTVERFEDALAERVGVKHAVAVSNGTAALHLSCLAAGIGANDIGLTSAITFAASANCFRYVQTEVRFADIDPQSLGVSAETLQRAGISATRAIVPVHMAGLSVGASEIRAFAGTRIVIEDAAHSLGGSYESGQPVGCCAHSDMTIFSFHPVKTITSGEGGAVLTNDGSLARKVRLLRSHGMERDASLFASDEGREDGGNKPWFHEQQHLGFNYRMTDIQAALGLSQLARLDQFVARRRAIALRYDEAFRGINSIAIPQARPDWRARSGLHLYVVEIDFDSVGTTREDVMLRLKGQGVGTQVHYIPVYRHPYYRDHAAVDLTAFPGAENYYRRCLSLPLYPAMTDEDVERVIGTVKEAVGG